MAIEFVVTLNHHSEYPNKLELPDVFFREAFNGTRNVYVSGIRGIRKKVTLVVPRNVHVEIRGEKWKEFVKENMDMDVNVLHFVQEGDDTFYLTGYNHMGKETGGYEEVRRGYYRFQTRVTRYPILPQTIIGGFLHEIGQEADIQIMCGGNRFDVHVNRVEPPSYSAESEYVLNADSWNALCAANNLVYGDVIVFTKVGINRLNLMAFNANGSGKTLLQFLGATELNLIQPKIEHYEESDDRMHHICRWNGHREHFSERTHVFYKRFSEILAFSRLSIPGFFLDRHPMHLYMTALIKHKTIECSFKLRMDHHKENPGRTNHVNAYGEWRQFGEDCDFEYTKMLRFRLVYIVTDLNNPQQPSYPLFHVC